MKTIVLFFARIFFKIFFNAEIKGLENIPDEGKCMLCINHISNYDAVLISAFVRRNISWMAKKELFDNSLVGSVVSYFGAFPVNREYVDITAIKKALSVLNSANVLGIFPEGKRIMKGMKRDIPKSGAVMIADKTNSPIIPIHINTKYQLFKKTIVTIGEKVYCSEIHGSNYDEKSKTLMNFIYSMD